MMEKKKYHVTQKDDGTWQGKLEGASRASVVAETKADAMNQTIEMAKKYGYSQVFIHKQNGEFQEERTYGSNDPSKSPG